MGGLEQQQLQQDTQAALALLRKINTLTKLAGSDHPYLLALEDSKELPNIKLAVQDFALQYAGFSKSFVKYIQALMCNLSATEAEILQENLSEELGSLTVADEEELIENGIDPEHVRNVPHSELYRRFLNAILKDGPATTEYIPEVLQLRDTMLSLCQKSSVSGLAALCWGSELIVPQFYSKIFAGIQKAYPNLSAKETVFFPLHIKCDEKHSQVLLKMVQELARNFNNHEELLDSTSRILEARNQLWSAFLKRARAMPSMTADKLYDQQSDNWVRREPLCLSDFTARPKIFAMCEPVQGLRILDIGCGEGYCAR